MLLNRIEYALMNSGPRALIQRHIEAPMLLRMQGAMNGGRALEIGCGRGAGVELILELFNADSVDAFDLDPRMIDRARIRLARFGPRVRFWVGDATSISAANVTYDAVFDFGAIHHVPEWRRSLEEVSRVLKPNGSFYAEEVLKGFIAHPIVRLFFKHPQRDRFDSSEFAGVLKSCGLESTPRKGLWGAFAWFTARKHDGA